MKRIEDIEKMSLEELEAAASETRVAVPEGLEDRIRASLAAKSAVEEKTLAEKNRRGWIPYASVAVAASLATAFVIYRIEDSRLKDTYNDPYLAYAQVEDAFRMISDKMAVGMDLASKADETAEKTIEIINKTTE